MSLMRNRPFQKLVAATVSNELADTFAAVVLPLIVLSITSAPSLVGVASFCSMGALIIMQCFSGALVDRIGASKALIGSSLAQGLGWAAVLGAAALHSVWGVIIFSTFAGAASGLDGPAEFALTKAVVKKDDVGRASAVA